MRPGAPVAAVTRQRACLYGSALLGLVLLAVRTAQPPRSAASLRAVTLRHDAGERSPPMPTILPTVDVPLADDCCGAVAPPRCPPLPAKAHIMLFASVPNVAADTARRLPLRAQWAKNVAMMQRKLAARGAPAARVELRFVIGTEAMPADQLAAVAAEAAAQRDMLLIDAPDKDEGQPRVRSATTLKVMHSMRYAVNNYVFDWFARIGDDAYFRVDYFAELALEHTYPKEWAYVGYKFANHIVSWRRGGRKERRRERKERSRESNKRAPPRRGKQLPTRSPPPFPPLRSAPPTPPTTSSSAWASC